MVFIYLFLYVRLQIVSIQILLYLLNISCSKSGAFCTSCFHRSLLYGVYGSAVTWWWRWSKFTVCLILTACDVNCFLCVQTCIYDGLFSRNWDFSFSISLFGWYCVLIYFLSDEKMNSFSTTKCGIRCVVAARCKVGFAHWKLCVWVSFCHCKAIGSMWGSKKIM